MLRDFASKDPIFATKISLGQQFNLTDEFVNAHIRNHRSRGFRLTRREDAVVDALPKGAPVAAQVLDCLPRLLSSKLWANFRLLNSGMMETSTGEEVLHHTNGSYLILCWHSPCLLYYMDL